MGDTKEVAVMSHPSLLLSSSSLLARLTMTSSRRDIPEKKEKKRKRLRHPPIQKRQVKYNCGNSLPLCLAARGESGILSLFFFFFNSDKKTHFLFLTAHADATSQA